MARKMNLDFTGVESFQRASEGEHVCKIASAEVKQSQGGNDMIVVAFEVTKGEDKGSRVYDNYALIDTALWKLKGLLQAIGMKCDGKVSLDIDKLVGKVVTVLVKHEEYEGKIRARVDEVKKFVAVSTAEDEEEDDSEEEEAPAPKKSKATGKKPPINEPEDDDDWEEDEEDEEPTPKKSKKEESKPAKKPAKKPVAEEEDDDDWDDEEEEEEKPAPKKKPEKKQKPAPKKPSKKADDEDDDDWDDDEDWDE